MYVPFTGLGLYGGFRGERWFRNRLRIFKQFVVPSLKAQTCQDFKLWISFTRDQKGHKLVEELGHFLEAAELDYIFTYNGICFYDDKHPVEEAKLILMTNLHNTIGELLDDIGEAEKVYMTIQPSDDCFYKESVWEVQRFLQNDEIEAVGYKHGYIMNYQTLEISDYNNTTNPPFYTIKFDKEVFIDPLEHCNYTALKHDVPGYEAGTPLPSHEWVKDCLRYKQLDKRGFLVGTHGENISTYYNHPFKGDKVAYRTGFDFGLESVKRLHLDYSSRKEFFNKLPHGVKRKLRYWGGEKKWILRPIFSIVYNFLRE